MANKIVPSARLRRFQETLVRFKVVPAPSVLGLSGQTWVPAQEALPSDQ